MPESNVTALPLKPPRMRKRRALPKQIERILADHQQRVDSARAVLAYLYEDLSTTCSGDVTIAMLDSWANALQAMEQILKPVTGLRDFELLAQQQAAVTGVANG